MEKGVECKCLYPFHISCTKLYVKYGEGMLGYCPIPLYPNSIYMIVLNVLQPHLVVQCNYNPSHSFVSSLLSSFPPPPLFSSPSPCPPSPFLLTSLCIILPPSPL